MGITGWIHLARDLRDAEPALTAMAVVLAPVALPTDVIRSARRAALGHRGHPSGYADWRHPERPDPDLSVVLDGRLSSRRNLEEQLYQRPRPLCSDAEVLLHAYRAWGAAMVQRIDGAYSIAVWDNLARELLLIRDPLGARTVFFSLLDGGVVFASQATALLAHPELKPAVDASGHDQPIALAPVCTPGPGIRDIAEVLPGELVRHTPVGLHRAAIGLA
ncbi:hypothetical protein [Actinoplanes sp. NPDC026619]|uniref:hypothetical protein n=1 Tax=Actinoplanes sp. NPDC026619 TaxID=3155798 RepID=UPI00340F6EB5